MRAMAERSTHQSLTNQVAWKNLKTHFEQIKTQHLRDLFAADPDRGRTFAVEAAGIYLDYSKNRIDSETMSAAD